MDHESRCDASFVEPHISEIPKFFEKTNINKDDILIKENHEERVLFLQKLSKESIDNDELQKLWILLEKFSIKLPNDERKMDYLQFKQIGKYLQTDSKFSGLFTATTFARLLPEDDNAQGRISALMLFHYLTRKIWMQQARVALSLWDSSGNGYLDEKEFENYIKELIPTLSKLNLMAKSYQPFYVCVAVRKFFFFLDPNKFNKIKILDILCSGFLDQMLELRNTQIWRPTREEHFNWFSPANTIRLHNAFTCLDQDKNGMLSRVEFQKFGSLNEKFVDRLFDACMTYNKEIDFKTFIDIMIALENRKEIQSIYFFFPILDIDGKHYLDDFTLRYYFKPIEKQMRAQGQEPIDFFDFSNEIFDMVRPAQPKRIYIEDLLSSGYADTIVSILIDINGFYAHENRDSNMIQQQPKDCASHADASSNTIGTIPAATATIVSTSVENVSQ